MTDVPSNLIPTRISQLPEYSGSSQEGYLPYVYQGVTYKVRFSNVASAGEVPPSRTLTAGTGLTGGGDLSADRVFAIADNGVGADQLDTTGVVAGAYGDASNIPTITVDANGRVSSVTTSAVVATGYVPETRVLTAGAGLSGGGNLAGDRSFSVNFSSAAPSSLGSASAGVANVAAREDHVHPAVDLSDATETQGTLPLGRGGTGAALSPIAGAVAYSTGSQMALSPVGVSGQVLTSGGTGAPYWATITGTGTVTSVNVSGGTSGLSFTGGPITTAGTITLQDPGFIQFDTAYGAARATGRLYWNNEDNAKTLDLGLAGSDVTLQIGQEEHIRVRASAAMTNGQVVYHTGTVGASGGLTAAPAASIPVDEAHEILGLATEDIALNDWGYVTAFGLVRGIDTSAFSDGDIVYYDPSSTGGLTNTVPSAPNPIVEIGVVIYSHASVGSIFVRLNAHFTLNELADVNTTGVSNGDLLKYNSTSNIWEDTPQSSIAAGTADTLATARTISLTGDVTGSASFDGSSNIAIATTAGATGTVTSIDVSGGTTGLTTSGGPVTSSGTITLAGTLAVANGGTGATTAAGALTNLGAYAASNPDGYTTNTGTVTSVAATVPTGFTVSGSPITTSGTLAIGFDTGYSLPTDAEQTTWDTAYADRYKWDGGSSGLVASTGRTSLGLGTSATLDAGSANGVATLDSGGTVPTSQLPAAVVGSVKYQGTWNASTNTPTLASGTGTKGDYYVVSVAGTTTLDGISDWAIGDWAIFNGSAWEKVDNTDAVTSVNGYTGTVVLDYSDVGAYADTNPDGYTTNTGTVTSVAASAGTGISITGSPITTSGTLTITNTAPDQTVTLTQGGTTTISGTYPNFTISSADQYSGTVTSVATSGTVNGLTLTGGPITGSGTVTLGGTLAINNDDWSGTGLSVANGGTGQSSYTNGQLLIGNTTGNTLTKATLTAGTNVSITNGAGSITINSTDQYSGTVTSVGGTGTVNGLTLSGTVTSSGNLTLGGTLAISNDDWSGTDLSVANGGTGASSLTSGYLLKGNGTSAVSASVVYDDGTNVGIGVSSPNRTLSVNSGTADVVAQFESSDNGAYIALKDSGSTSATAVMVGAVGDDMKFDVHDVEGMRLTNTGLGIGASSPSYKFHINGTGYASGDFRAPIFYDSDNTGYYVDPNSTSNVNNITIAGVLTSNATPTRDKLRVWSNGTYTIGMDNAFTYGGLNDYAMTFQMSNTADRGWWWGDTAHTDAQGAMALTTNGRLTVANRIRVGYGESDTTDPASSGYDLDVSGTAFASGDFRAPIFYDSNNTSYYLDAANTGTSLHAAGIVEAEGSVKTPSIARLNGTEAIALNNATYTQIKDPSGVTKLWLGNTSDTSNYYNNNTHYFRDASSNLKMTIDSSGNVIATGSHRAPIFYDSNNTAYYANPASTSAFNDLTLSGQGVVRNSAGLTSNLDTFYTGDMFGWTTTTTGKPSPSYGQGIAIVSNGRTHNNSSNWITQLGFGTDTNTAFFRGKTNAGSWGSWHQLFHDSYHPNADTLTTARTISLTGDVSGSTSFDGSANVSITATVADDSHNHIYDNIDGLTTNGWGGPRITTSSGYIDFGPANTSFAHIYTDRPNFYFNVGASATVLYGRTSVNTPILYDSDNTSRYLNPASESVISTLNLFGELNLSAATNYIDHTGTITFRNQSGFATSATLTTSGNFTATGNVTAYSDLRVKDNVEQIGGALDRIRHVRGVTYNRTDLENKERRYGGVIAQELEEVLPEAVFDHGDKKSVDYNATIGLLIEAVKELKAEVDELRRDAVTVKHKGK